MKQSEVETQSDRRSFLKKGALAAAMVGAGLFGAGKVAFGQESGGKLTKGADPVNLDEFRILLGSQATVAQDIGRLTNLMHLNVDTSWYIRYRSATNPDFGATFPQAITIRNRTAIPRTDADFKDANHIQAIANTAAFRFAFIEQGGPCRPGGLRYYREGFGRRGISALVVL